MGRGKEYDVAAQYADSRNLTARIDLHARYSTNPQGWGDWLFAQLGLRPGERILELGAGPGSLWSKRPGALPTGCRLLLSDASPGMVAEARQALAGPGVGFAVIDAQAIPCADRAFDRVIANHMLYHVADLPRGLAEIARVLRPQGTLWAATNGARHLGELKDLLRRFVPTYRSPGAAFTLENGAALLQAHFGEVELRRYEDGLRVTDAAALSAYVRSMGSLTGATEEQHREIERAIGDAVAGPGGFAIAKDTGLLVARDPR
ncbi:MAG: methyltransferase domain-containing protein [Gemmatimonadota bacterium]